MRAIAVVPCLVALACGSNPSADGAASGADAASTAPTRGEVGKPLPTGPAPALEPSWYFQDVTAWAHLDIGGPGAGIGVIDADGDGWEDVVVPGDGHGTVLRNAGDGSFYPWLELPHPGISGEFAYALDVTGDGRDELLYTAGDGGGQDGSGAPDPGSILQTDTAIVGFRPDGAWTVYPALLPPADPRGYSNVVTFGDFDGDGAHDLYFSRKGVAGIFHDPTRVAAGGQDRLLMRTGGLFLDATVGDLVRSLPSLAAMAVDIDDDGDVDLVVGSEGAPRPDEIFVNDGSGHFHERAEALGLNRTTNAMGFEAGDIDGDGRLDLVITDIGSSKVFLGGESGFRYATPELGLTTDDALVTWGVGLHDFDNDGDLDLFFANGALCEGCPGDANDLYLNDGTGHFTRATPPDASALNLRTDSRGAVFADFDQDGDVDVLVANVGGMPTLLRNDMATGHWLQVRLAHPTLSPVVGARVTVHAGGRVQTRWVAGTPGWGGSSTRWIHVGLGDATVVDRLIVRWPDGATQEQTGVAADQRLEIAPAAPSGAALPVATAAPCAAVCAHVASCDALDRFGVPTRAACEADCTTEPLDPYTSACLSGVDCDALSRCEIYSGEE